MGTIRKRANKFHAEVRKKGFYKSKTFPTKSAAQLWVIEIEQSLSGELVTNKTFGDAMQRYKEEYSFQKKGARWESIRLDKLSRDPIASILLQELRLEDLNGWRDRQLKKLAPSSVNRELNVLSAVMEAARLEWKWVDKNLVRDVRRPKNPPPRDRRMSEKEISLILKALGYEESLPVETQRHEIAVAFLFALETAMRQKEIWSMDWERVNLAKRFVCLPETKNGSKRDVALSNRAVELLEKLNPRDSGKVMRFAQESCGVIFRRALQLASIEDMTFHDTRHEALTRLARKLDVLDLARMVGHRDPRSLMIYYNATATEIAARLD